METLGNDGIAPPTEGSPGPDGLRWSEIPSSGSGESNESPDEQRVYLESDPEKLGIKPRKKPYTIG